MTIRRLVIQTENLMIRTLSKRDVTERYVDWLNNPKVNRFLEVRWHRQEMADVRRYVAEHDNISKFIFGIFANPHELHIGNASLRIGINHRSATLGVMIGDINYWGKKGIVLEARASILDFIFSELPVDKVSGGCYQSNIHAIYNYQHQGWEVDGIRRADRLDQGRRVDVINFAMFREKWLQRNDQ